MQDKRKAKSRPRGMNHLSRPPRVSFPPVRRTQGKNREKKGKARTKNRPPSVASGAFMASSSLHEFVPREKREVEENIGSRNPTELEQKEK
jgi:hypothetical protein